MSKNPITVSFMKASMHFFTHLKYILIALFILTVKSAAAVNDKDSVEWVHEWYHEVDSLKLLLNDQSLTEKQKLKLYQAISDKYHTVELDSAIAYGIKSIALAEKLNEPESLMKSYVSLGIYHSFKGDYDEAFACYERSRILSAKYGNKEVEAFTLSSTAFTYAKQGKHNMAIDYYLKYLKLSESEGWTVNCIRALANLGEINRRLGNTETSIEYLKQAEEKLNPAERWWMPQILNEYAFNYLDKGDYNEALRYALKADSVNVAEGTVNRCSTKRLLASIYLKLNDFDRALQYAKESYEQADILKDVSLYVNAGTILSDVYLAQKRYREAEAEALNVWQIDSTNIDEGRAVAKNIAMANIYMGNKERADYFLEKYSEMNRQYSEKSFQTTVSDMTVKYETEKKEARIVSLEKEQYLYVWLGITGILLASALAIVLMQSKRNERKERQLIAAKAVQDGEMGERARIAEDLHDRLGGSLAAVKIGLRSSEDLQIIGNKLDVCMKELREITQNLMPRSLRTFGMKKALEDFTTDFLNVHFHFFGEEKRIPNHLEYVVYCCSRELVNNALNHSGATSINLQLVQSENHVSVTVQDDGCGFDAKAVAKGNGLENIRNRIASCKGKFDIFSSPDKGTETTIELKIEN